MPMDVVDLLEVVEVEHEHGEWRVRAARLLQRLKQSLVEDAVVEEAGERVGAGLMLETRANLGVIERQGGRVAEPLRDLELHLAEGDRVAFAVDVERALDLATRNERDADQCLGLEWRTGHGAHARGQMRLVREHRLAVPGGPAGGAPR